MTRAALVLAALLAAFPAAAKESSRWGSFQFRFLPYRPNLDDEFGAARGPYGSTFGRGRRWMMTAELAKTLLRRDFGTFDLGVGAGYFQARGRGKFADGTTSADATALRIVPTNLSLTYRLDVLADRLRIPLAPYARVAFERYNWWTTKGSGGVAFSGSDRGAGATNGYSAAVGIGLLLDAIDRGLSIEMDRDTGINHTLLYGEASRTSVDDFGSSSSFDLSPDNGTQFSFGLLFVF